MQTQQQEGGAAGGAPVTVISHTNVHQALASTMLDVDPITKARKNDKQNFNFRGIDDVYNMLHAIFARHGLFVLPNVKEHSVTERQTANGGKQLHHTVRCCFRIMHASGTSVDIETYGEAADTGDKGAGKAQQYAYKVALLQAFLIPTEGDNDPDANAVEWSDPRPPARSQGRPSGPPPSNNRPPQRQAERGRAPVQRLQREASAGPAATNPAGAAAAATPAGVETPAQLLGKRLKDQLLSAKTPEELHAVRERLGAELQELRDMNTRTHAWVVDQVQKYEQRLTVNDTR